MNEHKSIYLKSSFFFLNQVITIWIGKLGHSRFSVEIIRKIVKCITLDTKKY